MWIPEGRKAGWTELPIGGVIPEAGSARHYLTGGWRTFRPILDPAKCTDCMICWFYCPDTAIVVRDGVLRGFDLDHCKGCGICAAVCPPKITAIAMVEEGEATRRYGKVGLYERQPKKERAQGPGPSEG